DHGLWRGLLRLVSQSVHVSPPRRVGVLWHAGSAQEEEVYLSVMQKAFHDLGYAEGRNIELMHRFPAETPVLFERFAKDLADQKVDAIIAVTGRSAREVKRATSTIPTVFVV